jgi:hypothetical protein
MELPCSFLLLLCVTSLRGASLRPRERDRRSWSRRFCRPLLLAADSAAPLTRAEPRTECSQPSVNHWLPRGPGHETGCQAHGRPPDPSHQVARNRFCSTSVGMPPQHAEQSSETPVSPREARSPNEGEAGTVTSSERGTKARRAREPTRTLAVTGGEAHPARASAGCSRRTPIALGGSGRAGYGCRDVVGEGLDHGRGTLAHDRLVQVGR